MRNEKGLTLIELLVAMVITMIVFLGLTEGILIGVDYNLRNAFRDEAVIVGENRMNEIRSLPFDNLVTDNPGTPEMHQDNVTRQVRGFTKTFRVTPAATNVDADLRQVDIAVAWTKGTKSYSHAFSTIVRRR